MVFIHPLFLWALLGISVPIAIHLFELRRPQQVYFSNVEFIQEVKLVTARQRRLKHWLVLAARIGLLVGLVLLFAQPYLPAIEKESSGTGVVDVLVDDSPSMRQLGRDEQPLIEQAIQEAAGLPLAFPVSARYKLLPGGRTVMGAAQYRAAVDQVRISGQAVELNRKLEQSQRMARGANGPLFIFSDFQRNEFSAQALQGIDTTRQLFLVPLPGQSKPNVFVDSVWLDDAFVRAETELLLHVRLRNGGGQVAENCQTKVFIGRQQAAAFRVTVPAQQAVTTQVRVRLLNTQVQQCQVRVEDYPVDFDNTYFFTLQPAAQIQVVEIAAKKELDRLYDNEPLFSYQQVNPQSADYRTIAAANLLILREVAGLSAGLRENVRRAVQQGATLVVVPSPLASGRESYGQLFRELGLGVVQWQPVPTGEPVLQEVAAPNAQNPFFHDVFAGINQRAGMPKAAPVLRWTRAGTEVLRMRDGEAYLAGFQGGAGMVYLFSAPFSAPYSDFSQHPLFVPVLYRLAIQSYRQEQQPAYRLNQQTVTLQLPVKTAKTGETALRLVQDSLTYIPVQRQRGSVLYVDIPPGMRQPGFYTLQQSGRPLATLAFNFDKRESDLRSYSAMELRQLVGLNQRNVHVYETGQGQTVAARYKATRVGVPLWKYCLWAALVCLLAEGILLRWNRRLAPVPLATAA